MRRTTVLGAATAAALAAGSLAVTGVLGSSHREAPKILADPTADNTDVYAFTAPDAPKSLTVVANWIPMEEPAGGPYFGKLDPRARYYVKIDNTGDGREDVAYRWQFKQRFRNPESFLDAAPTVDSVDDPDINFVQTYDLYKETYGKRRPARTRGSPMTCRSLRRTPGRRRSRTTPRWPRARSARSRAAARRSSGPADDPFFLDLNTVFDGLNIDKPGRPNIGLGNQGGGKDDVSGYNTHAFALQVPESEVTRDGKAVADMKAGNAVVGVWASTERRRVSVRRGERHGRTWVQVSRLGNPLINEVVIPIGQKDKFNRTSPAERREELRQVRGQPGGRAPAERPVQARRQGDRAHGHRPGAPDRRPRAHPDRCHPAAADTLKLNLGVPPSATPNRFGVLANDVAGFPNGRRLADDVTDITLRVVAGALLKPEEGGKQIPLGDGVDQNDKPFRSSFPYVALPTDGFTGLAEADRAGARAGAAAAGLSPRAWGGAARTRPAPRRLLTP